jgi:uncharacterized damage-inducible protein DinB
MQLEILKDLYAHMQWADALVWRAVLASDTACADAKLRGLFHHLHLVQHAFLRAWRGEAADPTFPTFEELQPLRTWGRSYYQDVFTYFAQLTDEQILGPAVLPWEEIVERQIGQKPAGISLAATMLQVPLHSLYHRGQINMRLRDVGGEPPTVDFIVWAWLGKPVATWEW